MLLAAQSHGRIGIILALSLAGVLLVSGLPALAQTPEEKTAVEEAVRRQEQSILMRKKLADAQAAHQQKDLTTAVKLYEDAYELGKKIGPAVDAEQQQVIAGLVDARIKLAKEAQKWGKFAEAEAHLKRCLVVDPRNLELPKLVAENDRLIAEARRTTPSREITEKVLPEINKLREKVDIMVQDGRLLYEVGRLDEAEATLREAAKLDPENKACFHYLHLVSEAKFARASRVREYDSANNFVDVEQKWIRPISRENLPVPNPYARNTQVHTSKGRQRIKDKLETIMMDEVFFDGLRLEDVVKKLSDDAKARDPDKKGINFILSANVDPPPPPTAAPAQIDPATGQPIAAPAAPAEPVNMSDIQIRINPALHDLRLVDVLEAIKMVSLPKIKYSIEDYAVVISLQNNEPEALYTRVFKVDANTFYQGLRNVSSMTFGTTGGGGGGYGGYGGYGGGRGGYGGGYGGRGGYGGGYGGYGGGYGGYGGGYGGYGGGGGNSTYAQVDIAGGGGGGRGGQGGQQGGGGQGGGIPWLTQTNTTALGDVVRAFFEAHGVTIDPPKTFFFNDRTGLLMVRAGQADLDLVEQAIEVLNMAPQQITIESRIAEFTQEDSRALGFDWWFGHVRMNSGTIDATTGTAPSLGPAAGQASTGIPGGNGIFPGPGPAGTTLTGPGAQAPAASDNKLTQALTPVGVPLATFTGILTDPQFRMVIRAIENRSGVDLLSCPKVTTLSGRQAQIKAVDIKYVVTDLALDQTGGGYGGGYYGGGGIGGGGGAAAIGSSVQPITEPMEVGPTLDVVPSVSADGYTIQLTLIPTLKEFLGYDDPGAFVATIQSVGGAGAAAPIITPTPMPKFRLRQVVTSCVVWDGQTVVLGGLISEDVQKIKDKVPVLGDLPLFGRLFRSESVKTAKKNLAIFVTPTLIDPAGNRLHSDEEMPFAAKGIPAQKPVVPGTPGLPAPAGQPIITP